MKIFSLVNLLVWGISFPTFASMKTFSFLSGCWKIQSGPYIQTESWSQPSESLLLGISQRRNNQNQTVEFEFVRIQKQKTGEITYTPYINGRQSIDFTLDSSISSGNESSGKVTFRNDGNTFPKSITYTRTEINPDQIFLRLEGIKANGQPQILEYPMFQSDCNQGI